MEADNAAEWDIEKTHRRGPATAVDDGFQEVTNRSKGKQRVVENTPKAPKRIDSATHRAPGRRGQRQSSRRWQNAQGMPTAPPNLRRPPKLLIETDEDPAQAQWRAREPPKANIRIPVALLMDGETTHETLATQNSAFVFSEQMMQMQASDSVTFGLWGQGPAVEAARRAIVAWVESATGPQRSSRASKFAKLSSMTPKLRERAENQWKREVRRQRFRQHPPVDVAFGAIGTFHWPTREYAPHEILGPSYEALDPIRMQCSCYVVWKKDAFQVMGSSMERVKAALLRLRRTVFQIAAKQLPPSRMYLLAGGDDAATVRLEGYEAPRLLTGSTPEQGHSVAPKGDGSDTGTISQQARRRVQRSLLRTLGKLPYFNGHVQMRFHFGRFLAQQYRLPEDGERYEMEEYIGMIRESQFHGQISDELGDREVEARALETLQEAKDLLMPLGASTPKLSEVKPIYTAIFSFADRAGDLRLVTSWQQAEDVGSGTPVFDSVYHKWTRLDKDTSTTSSVLDISLTDLTSSLGWAVTIEATQVVDETRLPTGLVHFASNIKVDASAALRQASDKPFVTFVPPPRLKTIQQRITYQYGIVDCDYNVELTRFQNVVYPERKDGLSLKSTGQKKVYEPRWGLTVHHGSWDAMFAQNERLSVGEMTSWEATSECWFPKDMSSPEDQTDDVSFGELMEKVQRIAQLLKMCKVESLMGGMSIG